MDWTVKGRSKQCQKASSALCALQPVREHSQSPESETTVVPVALRDSRVEDMLYYSSWLRTEQGRCSVAILTTSSLPHAHCSRPRSQIGHSLERLLHVHPVMFIIFQ